ncbi:MAG: hypothetical protein ACRCZD_17760 [Phycicoccus sp.]
MKSLPAPPKGRLAEALETIRSTRPEAYEPLIEHLLGGTSADWLAETMTEHGARVGPTSIKNWRISAREKKGGAEVGRAS